MASYHRLENIVAERLDTNPPYLALPNGKEYHVIFCFESTDRDWVTKYLEKLEGDAYQFRCCYDDRDFMASKYIIDNIGDLMQKSMTAIFVISPEHTTSPYCRIETCLALEQKGENQLQIIPVLRRGDQTTVPIGFRPIHYIDARDGVSEEKVLRKIVRAIKQGADPVELTLSQDPAPTPPDLNGTAVVIASQNGHGFLQKWSKVFEDVNGDHVRDCELMGSKIPQYVLEDIRRLMSDSLLLRVDRLINECPGAFILWLVITLVMCGIPLLLSSVTFVVLGMEDEEKPVMITFLVFGLVTPVVAGICMWRVNKAMNRFRTASMLRAGLLSQHLYQTYDTLVVVNNYLLSPSLQIFKYNLEDCQDSVANLLRKDSLRTDVTPEEIDQISKRVVHEAIPLYLDVLASRIPKATMPRHRVCGDVICLCQFVEIHSLHIKTQMVLNIEHDQTTIVVRSSDTDPEQTPDA